MIRSTMTKQEAYSDLVNKRKGFTFSHPELTNPASTNFDHHGHLEPWAQWQGNLDATIVVVGQEFCDRETYEKVGGTVEQHIGRYEYPANRNLVEYFALLGYDLGHPLEPIKENPIFFTNAVMGLKPPPMSSNFKDKWLRESREEFLVPLLDIIKPKVIITVGAKPTMTIGKIYGFPVGLHLDMVTSSPIVTSAGPLIFPVYHTGGYGLIRRPKAQQVEDWKRIKEYLLAVNS